MTPSNTSTLNSLKRAISAHWQNIGTRDGGAEILGGRVSAFGYLITCTNMLFLGWLIVAQPKNYLPLTQEDSPVENLTAALFLLAGVLLFFTAAAERSLWRRCFYILGGIGMVFTAGEEISWGQRIFNFATPDLLMSVNEQNEFNVHNIAYQVFDGIYLNGALLLCLITCVAFFFRKDRLFGIPLPSILLALCFLLALSYRQTAVFVDVLSFISFPEKGLLLLVAIYTLLFRKARLFIPAVASLALLIAVSYINYHSIGLSSIGLVYKIQEMREYLFSAACLFYAIELLLAQEAARHKIAAVSIELKSAGKRLRLPLPRGIKSRSGSAPASSKPPDPTPVRVFLRSPLLAMCLLVIMGSIGLILLQFFSARDEASTIETAYRPIETGAYGEPAIQADFDIYLTNDRLIYYKEECTLKDMQARFFLRITPVSTRALPDDRGQYGFGTQIFYLDWHGKRFEGKCLGSVPLPEYAIAYIYTGQYDYFEIPGWEVSIVVNSGALEALYESIVSGEPTARSTFDIYLAENTLSYTKQPCAPADIEARFFLHIIPASKVNLPISRWRYGFDNLDFGFDDSGVMLDGKCIATVRLPEYDIDRIATGQYTPDEGQLWKVEFPFRE